MKSKELSETSIREFTDKKTALREKFQENPAEVENLYNSLKGLSIDSLQKIFPAPEAVIEQNIFEVRCESISANSVSRKLIALAPLFTRKNIEKANPENFRKDMQLLQGLFFFLLRDICVEEPFFKETAGLFECALKENSWFSPEKQAEILNRICSHFRFLKENPFPDIDFTKFGNNYFKANESILRILSNFSVNFGNGIQKEKIINVINFVREQQKNILPVFPNTKKSDFTEDDAKTEIKNVLNNLDKLKELDSGFTDPDFTQVFFSEEEQIKKQFSREITCKFFQESEMEWRKGNPHFDENSGRIVAKRYDRATNKSALNHKFLYPERNMVTHISENFAVFNLFGKEYDSITYWESLILYALFDTRNYLISLAAKENQRATSEKFLKIINYYFQKIVKPLKIAADSDEERWNRIFDKKGFSHLKDRDLKKTDINSTLEKSQITHLRKFMSVLYCSGNEEEDFIEKHKTAISIYLIHLSFELARMDIAKD